MAGKTFNFLNGTEIVVKVGEDTVMVCQSISFQEQVNNQLIFGMGNYGAITNEPLQITGLGGTLRVLRYTSKDFANQDIKNLDGDDYKLDIKQYERTLESGIADTNRDGNSLASYESFSPVELLLEKTFDIEIWLGTPAANGAYTTGTGVLLHKLEDCIMGGYSIGFNAGAVSTEDYSFICTRIITYKDGNPDQVATEE